MRIQVRGRALEWDGEGWPVLGVQGDSGVEEVCFTVPRYTSSGADLSEGIAYLGLEQKDGSTLAFALTGEAKEISEKEIRYRWLVGQEATSQPGLARLALKISGLEGELWHTEPMHATISATLPIEGPQPAVYRAGPSLRIAQPEQEPPITVSERSLVIPRELQNIAVQNDRNSETVTLLCPRYFDGHDLSGYSFYLRTVNSAGGYDPVSLTPRASGTEIQMEWTLRPPQTSYNGRLLIQLWVTGRDFDWQTAEASVNIIRQIGGEPVIPVTPPVIDELLKQVSEYASSASQSAGEAASSAADASDSADRAEAAASNAAQSAANARDSEINAKKSETAAAGSLTDIETGLAGKLSLADAGQLIQSVTLDPLSGVFTFTRYDGTSFAIDTALERTVVNFQYDASSNELVLLLEDGTEQRISMAAFTNIYTGGESATISTEVRDGVITGAVRGGSLGTHHLSGQLQDTINGKITANAPNNASQVLFSDGKSMQEKLDSGELNGKDGVSAAIKGFYYMRVDANGDLIVGVADQEEPPPLSIRDGYLVYTLED